TREHRIAPPSMQPWHSARPYDTATGRKPAPLDDVESFAEFLDELRNLQEIITVIGIAHDDELSPRGRDATHESTAIPSPSYIDNAGSKLLGDRLTSIGASVIGNDDFSVYLLFI